MKHNGVPLVAGGFAVPQDSKEDRVISPLGLSELLDPEAMPRPKFAYIPRLRACKTNRGDT
eukprot:8194554-Lingulodinium_polyedra.AAC.1